MDVVLKIILWLLGGIVGLFLVYVAVMVISAYLVDSSREYDKNSRYYRILLEYSTAVLFFLGRVKIHKTGMDKIPDGRFLLVSNHRSKFDPLIAWHVFSGRDVAFISKKENFDVFVFGRIIRKCCFMAIDREDPRKALETINKAADLIIKDEVSIGLYPEGTRNYEEGLLPFHSGVFKIAQKANVPIVVLTLQGSEIIKDRVIRKRTDVYFDIVDVIPAEYVKSHRTPEISERVRDDMEKKLAEGDPNATVKQQMADKKAAKVKNKENQN